MLLYLKNMVCPRCIRTVGRLLTNAGLAVKNVQLGEAEVTNGLTFAVMGVSTIGVVQSLRAKRRFQCACLSAVFQLPMSKVTLMEDVLMVAMSGAMLLAYG